MTNKKKKKKKKKYQLLYRTWTESSDISNISASSSDSDITRVKINNNLPKIFKKRPYFQKVTSKFFIFFSKGYDYSHSATTTMSPVNLKDCMEEVVRYTLESHINETLEFDLGLSKSFCSDLLKLDPNDPNTTTTSGNYLITSSSSSLIYGSCSSLLEFRANCESKHVQEESQFS